MHLYHWRQGISYSSQGRFRYHVDCLWLPEYLQSLQQWAHPHINLWEVLDPPKEFYCQKCAFKVCQLLLSTGTPVNRNHTCVQRSKWQRAPDTKPPVFAKVRSHFAIWSIEGRKLPSSVEASTKNYTDIFWRRLSKEYLPLLQLRLKWVHPHHDWTFAPKFLA